MLTLIKHIKWVDEPVQMNAKFNIIFEWDNLSLTFKMGKMVDGAECLVHGLNCSLPS